MEGTTIWVSKETKELLDKMRIGSYDKTIKTLILGQNPYILSLTKTVDPETWITKEDNYKEIPFTGRIVNCSIFTPIGCQDLIKIRIGIGDVALTDWITSGDNKSLVITINKNVAKGELLWAEIQNLDTTYPHTPTIEVTILPFGEVT